MIISEQTTIARAALTAIDALAAGVPNLPLAIIDRKNYLIVQKSPGSGGVGFMKVTWRGIGVVTEVRLKRGMATCYTSSNGEFTSVVAEMYDVVLVVDGVECDMVRGGVGDVILCAGQSNTVSPLQPSTYAPPRPATPGRVIISDYYGQGRDSFVDAYDCPMVPPFAGCAWVACGIALNRPWPVMFVNLAQGNTTTAQWAAALITRVFDAVAIYKPKLICWGQGESDAGAGMTQAESFANMDACVGSLREVSMTPWLVAKNSVNGAGYAPIRAAQQQIIDKWAHVYQGPDSDTIRRSSGDNEFLGAELEQHGQLWATAISTAGY